MVLLRQGDLLVNQLYDGSWVIGEAFLVHHEEVVTSENWARDNLLSWAVLRSKRVVDLLYKPIVILGAFCEHNMAGHGDESSQSILEFVHD